MDEIPGLRIYIPSKGRADQKNHTWENLPLDVREWSHVVVGPEDYAAYAERFPENNIMLLPKKVKGIGKVRQFLIDEVYDGNMLMLDDDLSFFTRREDDPTKLRKSDVKDIRAMLRAVNKALDQYAHVAIAVREGANRCTDEFLYNTRCLRALGYHLPTMKAERIKFDRLPVMEDFDAALQLLRKGYPSCTVNKWCQDQGTSNAPGGCSTYRTKEVQAKGAHGLKKLHPEFVRVVEKETKGAWGGGVRTDVQVSWKKAYEEGFQ